MQDRAATIRNELDLLLQAQQAREAAHIREIQAKEAEKLSLAERNRSLLAQYNECQIQHRNKRGRAFGIILLASLISFMLGIAATMAVITN